MKQFDHKTAQSSAYLTKELASLLNHYVTAWEEADSEALVAVLREDVALTMPPYPLWYLGREDVRTFLDDTLFKTFDPFRVRLIPLRANGAPAFAVYQMDASGVYRAAAIQVLTIENGGITEINDFLTSDGKLFSRFGLALVLDR